jgi:feruloyl esterase
LNSIDYYERVVSLADGAAKIDDSYRLFMLPGMDHCRGGEGPDLFDALGTIDRWVETKNAPARIVASRIREGKVDRTRPLCPYPQLAVYKGAGSTDDAANFECRLK